MSIDTHYGLTVTHTPCQPRLQPHESPLSTNNHIQYFFLLPRNFVSGIVAPDMKDIHNYNSIIPSVCVSHA